MCKGSYNLKGLLLDRHLDEVGESWLVHFIFAVSAAGLCLKIAVILIVHGLFPRIWVNKGSNHICLLNEKFQYRHNK